MNLKNLKHIHLIGIGGINVSAIAKLLLSQGKKVSGSDLAATDLTRELERAGAKVYLGHKKENIAADVDLVIFTDAIPKDNPERVAAEERGLESMSAFNFWGEYAQDKKVVAVSGTNGKSTTTAMLGFIMAEAGMDPTVVVGTKVLQWGSNIRVGKSDWLVIEADEYHGHMLEFKPQLAVITNIAPDHLDYYKDLDDIIKYFQKWLEHLPQAASVVVNANDPASQQLVFTAPAVAFSRAGSQGLRSTGPKVFLAQGSSAGRTLFNIVDDKKDWGAVEMRLPGDFNIENALAAVAAADLLGIKHGKIIKALNKFTGTWRRFELVGEYNGALIVSDYAHHPDGIKATLSAARGWYPEARLVLLYQPHQRNRTRKLFDDFAESFDRVDELILAEIYDVAGRENSEDKKISSQDLAAAVKKHLAEKGFQAKLKPGHVSFAPNLESAEKMLRDKIQPNDIVIVMGAGDVDNTARRIVL